MHSSKMLFLLLPVRYILYITGVVDVDVVVVFVSVAVCLLLLLLLLPFPE